MVKKSDLLSFPSGGTAIVIGASGGIGSAIMAQIAASDRFDEVIGLGRMSVPSLDLFSEETIRTAAASVSEKPAPMRLIVDATGLLSEGRLQPEKSLKQVDAEQMARVFAVNAIGPALLMKHFLPLLPKDGKSLFATLSAKVGSIGDNHLGGWYSYRASKAALNQLVRTASIELRRRRLSAICVALHPGTVDTELSAPFARTRLNIQSPAAAASKLVALMDALSESQSGGFFAADGTELPW
jgi:NAD(P)-dependent dehydrogenase (short-subunit alcohol dehydrogenase family)